jgi:hypothetical protein
MGCTRKDAWHALGSLKRLALSEEKARVAAHPPPWLMQNGAIYVDNA